VSPSHAGRVMTQITQQLYQRQASVEQLIRKTILYKDVIMTVNFKA